MNREENLKKINAELEKLSDEELDNVVGGNCYETSDDSRFLNVLLHETKKYHQCDRYGATKVFFCPSTIDDVTKSWQSLGITAELCGGGGSKNKYFLNGKEILQKEAWAHAEKLVGKHLTRAQWDW